MTAAARAWECAYVLTDHLDRLTTAQAVLVHVGLFAGPERAPLGLIALAAQVLGERR